MTTDRPAAVDGAQGPASNSARRRKRVRVILLAIAALVAAWAVLVLLDAYAIARDLRSGRAAFAALTDKGFTGSGRLTAEAQRGAELLRRADRRAQNSGWLGALAKIPLAGQPARWLRSASHSVAELGREAAISVGRIEPRLDASGDPAARLQLLELLETETARLRRLVGAVRIPSTGGFLPPVSSADRELRADLARLNRTLADGSVAVHGLRGFLGGPSTYVVLAANNAEMRAGGMVLQVGVLRALNGRLLAGGFRSTGEVVLDDPVPLPPEIASLYGWLSPGTEWRNVGSSPNFPVTAPIYAALAQRSGLPRVDGALQIDVLGVRALLEVIGPVVVDGRRYDAANVERLLMHDLYVAYGDEQLERHHEFSRLAAEAFRVLAEGGADLTELAKAVRRSAAGRHLMAWSSRPAEQEAWRRLGLDGSLDRDGFMVTIQNHGGNKLDWFLRSSVTLAVEEPEGRFRRVRARIRIENRTPFGEPIPVAGDGSIVRKNAYRAFVAVYLPAWAINVELIGHKAVVVGTDGPMRVVGTRLDILRGESATVELIFSVPPEEERMFLLPSARAVPMPVRVEDRTTDDAIRRRVTV